MFISAIKQYTFKFILVNQLNHKITQNYTSIKTKLQIMNKQNSIFSKCLYQQHNNNN
jgi:hypothetical protein